MIKELEDYIWFPAILRRWQMEYIGNVAIWFQLYKPLVPVFNQLIDENKFISLQDTCSGSGIPAVYVHKHISTKLPMLLTDKYPDRSFKNQPPVIYSLHSVDLLKMQPAPNIIYTMYNSFHHFSATQQKLFVKKMADSNAPFLIAEILEPNFFILVKIIFTTTILQIITAAFVNPFSLSRLFFTYIIPVNLFTITYDGIISVIKSKTAKEYYELFKNIPSQSFEITINKINNWKGTVVYIKGAPINK